MKRISDRRRREWAEGLTSDDDPIYNHLTKIRSLVGDAIAARLDNKDPQRKVEQIDQEMKKLLAILRTNQPE